MKTLPILQDPTLINFRNKKISGEMAILTTFTILIDYCMVII